MIPTEHRTGSLFKAGRFSPLSRTHVIDVLRQLLQEAGYDSHVYSSHSFRIGAATTSAAAGLPPWLIKTLGRWNSNAYVYDIYSLLSSCFKMDTCTDGKD